MLRAKVRTVTDATRHVSQGGGLPRAERVEISPADGMFYLIRYAANGAFAGDTCHMSLAEAFEQARYEFALEPDDWSNCEPDHPK